MGGGWPNVVTTEEIGRIACLTDAGWDAMHTARAIIAAIEADWAQRVGPERFEAAARTLDALLRDLTARDPPRDRRATPG
jgi:hypothetical protein